MKEKEQYARYAIDTASQITGIEYATEEDMQDAVWKVMSIPGWDMHYQTYNIMMSVLHDNLKFGKFLFVPLSECVPDIRNEDLIEFIITYISLWYGVVKIKNEEQERELIDKFSRDTNLIISIIYSGYDLDDWVSLFKDLCYKGYYHPLDVIDDFLMAVHDKEHKTGDKYDVSRFCKVSETVKDLKELVRIALAVIPDVLTNYSLRSLASKYIFECRRNTGMNTETIYRLVDNYIPISYKFFEAKASLPGAIDEEIAEYIYMADTIIELYYLAFGELEDKLNTIRREHENAFDMLSRLLVQPDMKKILNRELVRPEDEETAIMDFPALAGLIVGSTFDSIAEVMCYSANIEEAGDAVTFHLLAIRLFAEGLIDLLEDDRSRSRILPRIRTMDEDNIDIWIERARTYIFALNALVEFPRDLAAAVILGIPPETAYSYIISRGGVLP